MTAPGWVAKRLPYLKSFTHSYNDETGQSYILPKEDPNLYESRDILSFTDISIFLPEISNFCYIKKYRYRLDFNT